MLEDWVDEAEIEATRSVRTGTGRAPAGEAPDEAPAVEPDASAVARRGPPRTWRGGWFALLAVGFALVMAQA